MGFRFRIVFIEKMKYYAADARADDTSLSRLDFVTRVMFTFDRDPRHFDGFFDNTDF